MDFNNYFRYKDGKLFWRLAYGGHMKVGQEAGNLSTAHGYHRVGVGGRLLKRSRIVWEMHNGEVPAGMQIDHINHKRDDDHIENLRLVTEEDNHKNYSLRADNKTGIPGVQVVEGTYLTTITSEGIRHRLYKGLDFFEACCERKSAELKYNYHPNHGAL